MNVKQTVIMQAMEAKKASLELALLSSENKNNILNAIANALEKNVEEILFRNSIDVESAQNVGLSNAFIDRLTLTKERILEMANSVKALTKQNDPIGEIIDSHKSENGLLINKKRVPLGVIGIIYESRPNVTIDTIALAIKSGNAIILKGGSESLNSNHILTKIAIESATEKGLPQGSIQFIDTADRDAIIELLKLDHLIDVIIPRGSKQMIDAILEISKIPVIKHGKGLCHTYIDKSANLEMALNIAYNAKVQRAGVCNAMETLLVHKDIAREFLPAMTKKFLENGVELRGCEKTLEIVSNINSATDEDWDEEYLDLILSIKIVDSLKDAIDHIRKHGTGHSEAIITDDKQTAERFLQEVDSATVYVNASTRFTDGGQFGLGAEIGISTQKLHARGPMGINELTSYKFVVYGNGQIRE
jgi:glutamate-5-semialdehyde dehydrogenase